MKTFDIRIEYPDRKYEDVKVGGEDLKDAIARFESSHNFFEKNKFDWHGQVVFVNGAIVAENVRALNI